MIIQPILFEIFQASTNSPKGLDWLFIVLILFFIVAPGIIWVGLSFYTKARRKPIPRINWIMLGIQLGGIFAAILILILSGLVNTNS
ncbi:hypothetical protein SGLAD_v1c02290 [Spiroplasma gladiatoris]|uniref:Uncharacterized protein n=1 Tax=Spiroplasma gladiatoris TaxID=2143 RepID=A0A4P7AI81_9MOLU|nr:hypothetical protein [Spiroplasma gladiatoris]QBQ07428.1 hypothetical protein SGLAD_v1c02290 [Spiroplasma gladiatoris]